MESSALRCDANVIGGRAQTILAQGGIEDRTASALFARRGVRDRAAGELIESEGAWCRNTARGMAAEGGRPIAARRKRPRLPVFSGAYLRAGVPDACKKEYSDGDPELRRRGARWMVKIQIIATGCLLR